MSITFILELSNWKGPQAKGLVNISTTWCWVWMWRVRRMPSCILSRTRWQSSSMCLVLSWKTRFAAIWRAAFLSQKSNAACGWSILKSLSKDISQTISHAVEAMDQYSASAENRDIVCCFLDFKEIRDSPKKTQKPVMERRVSGHPAQSESQKAFKWKVEEAEKKRPWPGDPLRYLKILYFCIKMGLSRMSHKLTKFLHCIWDVRACDCQVEKTTN
jgi:hypothetical protein